MAERYEFGDFYLDVRERRLERGKTPVHLEPKAFELLFYLVTHAGSLVEKEELLAAIWSSSVVTDNSITRCVHQVRNALGDEAASPRYVETVPGAGYRFVAPVDPIDAPTSRRPSLSGTQKSFGVGLSLTLVAALVIVAITLTPQRDRPHRLAVLPLANLTGDSDRQYFVDGLHEALIADLSRIETLT